MRLIAVWLIPVAAAIERVDQWVASLGCSSRVLTITRSTSESLICRGLPGLGSSWRPSRPRSAKAPSPPAHGRAGATEALGDVNAALSVGRRQDDPAAQRQGLGAGGPTGPPLQHLSLFVAENYLRTYGHNRLPSSLAMATTSTGWPLCLRTIDSGH